MRFEIQTKLNGKWLNFYVSRKTFKNLTYAKKKVHILHEYQRLTNKRFDLRIIEIKGVSCEHCGQEISQ